jgi:putative hydrolase of the HAD superfamily
MTKNAQLVVFTDADNTLWDTNKVYADAQLTLLENVEQGIKLKGPSEDRLEFVREYDQQIAATHHKGLRYPPHLLCQALALGVQGYSPKEAFNRVWSGGNDNKMPPPVILGEIESQFLKDLSQRPQLCDGVLEGLNWLKKHNFPVIVVTEGVKEKVLNLLAFYNLIELIDRVIENQKNPVLYRRILRLMNDPQIAIMVGDQMDRDIAPAQEVGLIGVFIPGGFSPIWSAQKPSITPDFELKSFSEIPKIIEKLA